MGDPVPARLRYEIGSHVIELVHVDDVSYAAELDGVRRPIVLFEESIDMDSVGKCSRYVNESTGDVANLRALVECVEIGATVTSTATSIEIDAYQDTHFRQWARLSITISITADQSIAITMKREGQNESYY